MNAFEKYARTLSYHLPVHLREEVVREVMGGLYAELDAARSAAPFEDSDRLMRSILRDRQPARALAAAFVEGRSALIGPRVFPMYRSVLRVSLAVTAVTVASLSLATGFQWSMLGDVAIASVLVFTCITLTFVAIDQLDAFAHVAESMTGQSLQGPGPAECEPSGEQHASSARPRVARWTIALMLLVCINLVPNLICLFLLLTEPRWHFVAYPILSGSFLGLPRLLLSAWCIAVLVIDGLSMLGKAAALMPKLQTALALFGLAVGATLLSNGPLFGVPPVQATSAWPADLVAVMNHTIAPYLFQMLTLLFWLSLVARAGWMLHGLFKAQRMAKLSY